MSPCRKRMVPPAFSTYIMFFSESCSRTLPSCTLQNSFPSVRFWKNHSSRKEVGCLSQDCIKQCNNCVPILNSFFLRASLPLLNMHCGNVWLDLPETVLCCASAVAEKHGGFPSLLLFVCTQEYLVVQILCVKKSL